MARFPTTTEPSTETAIASRPAAATRAGDVLVATYRNRLDRSGGSGVPPAIRADQAPPEEHRAAMTARLATLHDGLTDGEDPRPGQVAKRDVVPALLAAFPTFGVAADGARATANLYVRALALSDDQRLVASWRAGVMSLPDERVPCPGLIWKKPGPRGRFGVWAGVRTMMFRFVEHWGEEAAALGWSTESLFGVHRPALLAGVRDRRAGRWHARAGWRC